MAAPAGTQTTYTLTTGIKLDIEDMIHLISPFDTPLIGGFGADNLSHLSNFPVYEKMYQWMDETLLTPRTTLAVAMLSTDTTMSVATGTGVNFQAGDLVLVDNEYMQVTGTASTDVLDVSRAFSGVAAAHVLNDPVIGVGSVLPEGTDAGAAVAIDRVNRYNMTQIFGPRTVQVSGSENAVQKYGLTGTEFDHQVANRIKELAIMMEQAVLYGVRTENTGSNIRSMGGMAFYITTNVDSTTTSINDATFLQQVQNCFDAGGHPDRALAGSQQKKQLSSINSSEIRYEQTTNARGQAVRSYLTDFGEIGIVLDRWVRPSNLFLFSREQAGIGNFRPLQFEALAKTGDSSKGMIVAEKTFEFSTQTHAAMFTALT